MPARSSGSTGPYPVQYLIYVRHLLHGDFGRSLVTREPIIDNLKMYYPATVSWRWRPSLRAAWASRSAWPRPSSPDAGSTT